MFIKDEKREIPVKSALEKIRSSMLSKVLNQPTDQVGIVLFGTVINIHVQRQQKTYLSCSARSKMQLIMNLFMYFKLWIFLTRQGSKKSMVLFKVIIIVNNFSIKHAYSQKKEKKITHMKISKIMRIFFKGRRMFYRNVMIYKER
jgi:ABC-type xylose transport system permease subunit